LSSVLTYQSEPSGASVNSLGRPLPRGSAHSLAMPPVYRPMRALAEESTHHTPAALECTTDGTVVPRSIGVKVGVAAPLGVTRSRPSAEAM
jgi:hypothetical protein